jgi:hypothetical protein
VGARHEDDESERVDEGEGGAPHNVQNGGAGMKAR